MTKTKSGFIKEDQFVTSHSDLVSEEVEEKKVEIPRPSVSRDWTSHKQEIMIVPSSYCKASSISITVLQLTNIIICNVLFFKINHNNVEFSLEKRNFFPCALILSEERWVWGCQAGG